MSAFYHFLPFGRQNARNGPEAAIGILPESGPSPGRPEGIADIAGRAWPREDVTMSRGIEDWAGVRRVVAEVIAARPNEYAASVVRNLDDLLAHIQRSNRPAPSILPGYWPTFLVEWQAEEAKNLQIEVFDDRYEVSRFFDGRTDIWYEPHAHGDTFSDQFIAELPNAG